VPPTEARRQCPSAQLSSRKSVEKERIPGGVFNRPEQTDEDFTADFRGFRAQKIASGFSSAQTEISGFLGEKNCPHPRSAIRESGMADLARDRGEPGTGETGPRRKKKKGDREARGTPRFRDLGQHD
jgi:hypothetical protein